MPVVLAFLGGCCGGGSSAPPEPPAASVLLALGDDVTCVRRGEREVFCWGAHHTGELRSWHDSREGHSEPLSVDELRPIAVPALEGARELGVVNGGLVLAWTAEGDVDRAWVAWPDATRDAPWSAASVDTIAFGPTGDLCGRTETGGVACGDDQTRMLTPIAGIARVHDIGVGDSAFGRPWACATTDDGRVFGIELPCNAEGSLSSGALVREASGLHVRSSSVGFEQACGIVDDVGTVTCWSFSCAADEPAARITPPPVPPARTVACGGRQCCAIGASDDRAVTCWGRDPTTATDREAAVESVRTIEGATGAVSLGVSDTHACIARSDASIWCWGLNPHGQLGDGTTTTSTRAVRVLMP